MTRYRKYLNFFSDIHLNDAGVKIHDLYKHGFISIFEHETLLNAIEFARLAGKRERVLRFIRNLFLSSILGILAGYIFFG